MRARAILSMGVSFGLAICCARHSHAEASAAEKASAEALFDEGVRLMLNGAFAQACPKLELSQRVDPGVGTMLYLAECYERTGRTASAWATFREAASLAETFGQPDRMKTARSRAARLEPDLAWLTIELDAQTRALPGLQIRRASLPIALDMVGLATPVDTGEIVVEASAPGHASFSTKIIVAPRARDIVNVPSLPELPSAHREATPGAGALERKATPMSQSRASSTSSSAARAAQREHSSALPWVFDGIGVVGIAVGTVFGIKALSDASDARDECPRNICNDSSGKNSEDSAHTAAWVTNVAFAVGVPALAAGIVLHVILPKTKEGPVAIEPMLDRTSVGLSLTGHLGS